MSDISYSIRITVSKDGLSQSVAATAMTSSMAVTGMMAVTLDLATATEQISTVSMSTLGLCVARSLVTDTTGTTIISFGRISGTTLFESVRLEPGETNLFRMAPGNYAAKANVNDARLLIHIFED